MNLRKITLTLLVLGITTVGVAAPKGPPSPGCWPPSTCIPVNKGMVFLAMAGVGVAYLAFRKRPVAQ